MGCEYGFPPQLVPANETVWNLYLAVQTQWRAGGMGVIGLDYAEVRHAAARLEIDMSPGMWRKIRTIEKVMTDHGDHEAKGS